MRILVTGAAGFAGGHLCENLLQQADAQIFGLSRGRDWPEELKHLKTHVPLLIGDLTDRKSVAAALDEARPDQVFHLAGYAHAGESTREPEAAWAGNLVATRNLYDALAERGGSPRVLYVSSGLIYGDPDEQGHALDERSLLEPASPYAASKAAADLVSFQYTRSAGLDIVRARPFNHIGPRQSPRYAAAHFAQQIARAEKGTTAPVMETGNLEPLRDFTDVRDVVEAYRLLMERGRTGQVYNIASGLAHSMREVLQALLELSTVNVEVRQRPDLVRRQEKQAVRGDAGKLQRELGWSPRFTLEQTLRDTLEYWRSRE